LGENEWTTFGENRWTSLGENGWTSMGENGWTSMGENTESAQLTFMRPLDMKVQLTRIGFFDHVGKCGMALLEAAMPCLFAGVPPH